MAYIVHTGRRVAWVVRQWGTKSCKAIVSVISKITGTCVLSSVVVGRLMQHLISQHFVFWGHEASQRVSHQKSVSQG